VACRVQGHANGVPYIKVRATEVALEDFLELAKQEIEFVEPDLETHLIPNVPNEVEDEDKIISARGAASWGLERIGVPHPTRTGKGVHVYVLDTGVRTTHDDFEGRAIPTLDYGDGFGKNCKATDQRCAADRNGHGTHTAGTVGGRTYGVAKDATIHAVKILADDGRGQISWIVGAMDWITRHGEKPAVMSMSLGGRGRSRMQEAAVHRAVSAGITVVVAAGNERDDACNYSPAFVQRAITVGATDSGDMMASYSNYGSCVQIFAPGTNIRSASNRGDRVGATLSGTSMACPHVAGAAALLLGDDASQTPGQILTKLVQSSFSNVIGGLTSRSPNKLLSVSKPDHSVVEMTSRGWRCKNDGSAESSCARHGTSYNWCRTDNSNWGGLVDWDYCAFPPYTSLGRTCPKGTGYGYGCARHGSAYTWCYQTFYQWDYCVQ